MVKIIYTPEKERPIPRKGSLTINGVLLNPGVNVLTQEDLQRIISLDSIAQYQAYGALEIETEDAKPSEESPTPKRRRSPAKKTEDESNVLLPEVQEDE